MFGSLGFPELILIFMVALIVFGPRKLPEIGRSIGRALGEFRRATTDLKSTLEDDVRAEDRPKPTESSSVPTPATPRPSIETAGPSEDAH